MDFLRRFIVPPVVAMAISGLFSSDLLAQVNAVAPRSEGRAVVAVQVFEDQANSGQGAAFREMVETAVTQTNRFHLMTRNETGIERERRDQRSGRLTNRAGSATTEGAQYVVSGTITTASVENRQDILGTIWRQTAERAVTGVNSGVVNDCRRVRVTLSIDLRIQDLRTGENRVATSVDERLDSAIECAGQGGGGQVNLGLLLRNAARRVANLLVTTIYPIQIASVQADGTVILNYGDPLLTSGMVLNLYGPATQIQNPSTGEAMTIDGQILGQVRVTEATPTYARAQPVRRLAVPPIVGGVARPVAAAHGRGAQR
jgi:curli biogenesis system outer membrane secretion channel CsgG